MLSRVLCTLALGTGHWVWGDPPHRAKQVGHQKALLGRGICRLADIVKGLAGKRKTSSKPQASVTAPRLPEVLANLKMGDHVQFKTHEGTVHDGYMWVSDGGVIHLSAVPVMADYAAISKGAIRIDQIDLNSVVVKEGIDDIVAREEREQAARQVVLEQRRELEELQRDPAAEAQERRVQEIQRLQREAARAKKDRCKI